MNWLNNLLPSLARRRGAGPANGNGNDSGNRVPEGLWSRCDECAEVLYRPDFEANLHVCPKCQHHMRLGARRRLETFLDAKPAPQELGEDIGPVDRLKFRDVRRYRDRLRDSQKKTGEKDALVVMRGRTLGVELIAAAFEFDFQGGSMGQAVGEKFARAATAALEARLPMVCFSASGGARMQEGIVSLMQMSKTSAVLERMKRECLPYISVLTDPVYGGVSASLASLGDINLAEPGARSGFAGPNIIRDTMRLSELPDGFQRSEFLLQHGAIDGIVKRSDLREVIANLLAMLCGLPPPANSSAGADKPPAGA